MSDYYDCFVDMVIECLEEADCRATPIQLTRYTGRVMNATTCELEPGTTSTIDLNAVTAPYQESMIDGTTRQEGDIAVIADSQQAPEVDDEVNIDGQSYGIIATEQINPGGVVIAYIMQVRR